MAGLGCARNRCTAAYYGTFRDGCFMTRAYNFSAGPATLPETVLLQAQAEMQFAKSALRAAGVSQKDIENRISSLENELQEKSR